jgi:spore germination protein
MMKRTKLFLIIVIVILLSGCSFIPPVIVNEVSMIQGLGYDLSKEKKIKGTYVYPEYIRKNATMETITGSGATSKEVKEDANNKVRHPLVSGQLRLALYSKSLAKNGIYPVIDTIMRDPSIGTLIQMAIVDGETKEVLTLKSKQKDNVALYIQEMLEQNMDSGKLPFSDFNTFMFQYFQEGQDPYLPLIKIEGEDIQISGIAIFKEDKYEIEISRKYQFIFKSLVEKSKQGVQQFILENGDKVVIDNIKSKPKYEVKMESGKPSFDIHVKIVARIQEYASSKPISLPNITPEISKQIENQLEKDGLSIIKKFQENNVDPLGLGSKFEAHQRNFDKTKWEDQYSEAKINLKVKVQTLHSGIVD